MVLSGLEGTYAAPLTAPAIYSSPETRPLARRDRSSSSEAIVPGTAWFGLTTRRAACWDDSASQVLERSAGRPTALLPLLVSASLDACTPCPEPVQRGFGRRALFRGGQQKRQAGVRAQRRRLENEIEVADEWVVERE